MLNDIKVSYDFGCIEGGFIDQNQYEQLPHDLDCGKRYADSLASRKEYPAAARIYLELAEKFPSAGFSMYFKAGICFYLQSKYIDALNNLRKARHLNDDHQDLHIFMGLAFCHLGLLGRANLHWWAAHKIEETETTQNLLNRFFFNNNHPERLSLLPLCSGKGIDVGCGNRKTHPDAIGVDIVPQGVAGTVGSVTMKKSEADIEASGDNLKMFDDNQLDYVVQRHNLEHYQDCILAVQKWKRVVKPGGVIGMVVPDDDKCDTISLDPTHKHVFTQSSLRRMVKLIGGLKIVYMHELLKNWSFICILQKAEGHFNPQRTYMEYEKKLIEMEREQLEKQTQRYNEIGNSALAVQCREFMDRIAGGNTFLD